MLTGWRRHHGEKRAQKVLEVWRGTERRHPEWYANDSQLAQALLRTRVLCSQACCGNPRKWFGEITRQERKANEEAKCQIEESLGQIC